MNYLRSALAIVTLALAACSMSNLTTILTTITAAAEVAVPIIAQATGLNPDVANNVMTYLHAVSGAITETTIELQSADTSAVRAEKISAIWAGVALQPSVLQSLPPNIRTIVQAVAAGIQDLIGHLNTARATAARASTGNPVAHPDFSTSRKDKSALAKLAQRSTAVSVAVDKWKLEHGR